MKKAMVLWILAMLCYGTSVFAQTTRLVSASSTSPSPPYTTWATASHTIQAAIDVSNTGDTIYVDNGLYAETLTIDVDVTLQSYCREPQECIIEAPSASVDPVITISDPTLSSGVITVRGFTITGDDSGVYIPNNETATANYPVIANCILTGFSNSAVHGFNANFIVEFCTIVENDVGVFLDNCAEGSLVRYNIIADNAIYGVHVGASTYLAFDDNCYYANGAHLFGLPSAAWCDRWSAEALPDGIDPVFVNPATGDYHLAASSPCIDFSPGDYGFPDCARTLYDTDESPFDLGAYGGNGQSATSPNLESSSRSPAHGATYVSANAPISFTITDYPAGIDLSTLLVTVSDHGYAAEVFDQSDLTILGCPVYGQAYSDCGLNCLNVTLPGAAHQPFVDYSYVRITVDFYDLCPTPNHYSNNSWRFRANDLTPPVMLPDFYPANGGTNVRLYGPINIGFTDTPGVGIRTNSLQLTLNGSSLATSSVVWVSNRVTVYPATMFLENALNTLTVTISDNYSNVMPIQTISFTTAMDDLPPFVPGVTTPAVPTPGPTPFPLPTTGPIPAPAPMGVNVDPSTAFQFSLQDYETTVDVTDLTVLVSTGLDTWSYTQAGAGGTETFQVSGSNRCRRITCSPVTNWGENQTVNVTVSQGADSAINPNIQTPAIYQFTTGYYPVPSMGMIGTILALIVMSIGILIRRR